jgi:hypothetical protein
LILQNICTVKPICNSIKVVNFLKEKKVVSSEQNFIKQKKVTNEQLMLIHTKEYIEQLKWSHNLAIILEFPMIAVVPNFLLQSGLFHFIYFSISIFFSELVIDHSNALPRYIF